MGVPKRKRSRQRRDKRFANKGIKAIIGTNCKNCSDPLSSHAACKNCGFYKGAKVLVTKAERGVKRGKAKEAKASRTALKAQQAPSSQEQE